MEIETARDIVKQFFKAASDPALDDVLTKSKGSDYRPYYTASFFIWTEYRQLTRADEVSFTYDKLYAIKGLLSMQAPMDKSITDIPPGFSVDDFLALLPGADNYQPGAFMVGSMSDDSCVLTNAFQGMEIPGL